MFWHMKNRIKEETGNDVDLISSLVNSNQPKTVREKHSHQDSTKTLGSFTIDGNEGDVLPLSVDLKLADGKVITPKEFKKLESKEEEWRRKLQKKDEELTAKLKKAEENWKKQLEEKEMEMKEEIDKKENEKKILEEEKNELKLKIIKLEESAKKAADYQKKVCQYQEDIDQLEGYQTQEMAKVKHLLLVKEQEIAEKNQLLKENNNQIKNLKAELLRLRHFEQQYENSQKSLSDGTFDYESKLNQKIIELDEKEEIIKNLEKKLSLEREAKDLMESQFQNLNKAFDDEKKIHKEINTALEKEKRLKDDLMMRNAQISQEMELARQEIRKQESETNDLHSKINELEEKLSAKEKDLDGAISENKELELKIKKYEKAEKEQEFATSLENDLKSKIIQLENELLEKNKNVKILQQRLSDMKKTLQRELKVPANTIDPGGTESDGLVSYNLNPPSNSSSAVILNASSSHNLTSSPRNSGEENYDDPNDDINFKYLKHVLMKFLTSRECEAQHLTRAVATLLRFSEEEERLLKETLEWKMSWFGTKPSLGNGQSAKTIRPS